WTGAKEIDTRFAGKLPRRAAELREVKGIGPYTAGAIASIAAGERTPLVDGNVARVLARVFAIEHDIKGSAGTKALWKTAGELMTALPEAAAPGDLNQGLMELGATLCSPTSPRCLGCPLAVHCIARRDGRTGELPVIAPRKKQADLPVLERTLVWIERTGGIVIARRRPDGLFGGLWELPDRELAEQLGARVDDQAVAHHDQVLTHRRLRVTVVCGTLDRATRLLVATEVPGYDAVARVALVKAGTLGVAAATTAILRKYQDNPWNSTPKPSRSSPRGTRRSSKASASSATTSTTRTSPIPRSARRKASTSSSTTRGRSRPR
ncbi:MAG: NUDIX domain-containing protein, partial [Deltaproteobacteria bacterium]|nr:NUDIX domain-containing protein [Deltaproteobacteria bacterium]